MRVLCALVMLTPVAACGRSEEAAAPEVRPVRVVTVDKRAGGDTVSLTGTVQAEATVDRAFRIDGRMTERLVNVGDRVEPCARRAQTSQRRRVSRSRRGPTTSARARC